MSGYGRMVVWAERCRCIRVLTTHMLAYHAREERRLRRELAMATAQLRACRDFLREGHRFVAVLGPQQETYNEHYWHSPWHGWHESVLHKRARGRYSADLGCEEEIRR